MVDWEEEGGSDLNRTMAGIEWREGVGGGELNDDERIEQIRYQQRGLRSK